MIKLKICIIGHYKNNPDEGVKNIAHGLFKEFSVDNDVMKCDVSNFIRFLSSIKKFNPETIHLVVGPSTIMSFIITKMASIIFSRAAIVMSAPQPTKFHFEWLIRFLKPDKIFVQSNNSEERFRTYSCKTKFIPAGVDTDRFLPVELGEKIRLRLKYSFNRDDFIILHVGHITKGRNISALSNLGKIGKVIIVGSTTARRDDETYDNIKKSGALIITEYLPNIEEIYSIADCYVLPTKSIYNCIETPLSVLEAMSCNLPVVAMTIGALPRMFRKGCKGLFLVDDEKYISRIVETVKHTKMEVETRKCVMQYSYKSITSILKNEYSIILKEKGINR